MLQFSLLVIDPFCIPMHYFKVLLLVFHHPWVYVALWSSTLGMSEGGTPVALVGLCRGSEPGTKSLWKEYKDPAPHRLSLDIRVIFA
jgi:hypothetical protein